LAFTKFWSRAILGHLRPTVLVLPPVQEAQLSQRDRAMLRVIDYFVQSFNIT